MSDGPMSQSPAELTGLPAEIMELVTDYLPKEDVPSLRLVCKDLENKTLRPFELRCLSEKGFVIGSFRSMHQLKDLSQHHRFSRALNRITFICKICALRIQTGTNGRGR